MRNAPETIWMFAANLEKYLPGRGKIMMGDTEYRRADLPPTPAQIMADPQVQALVAATRRQVENVERWLETGTPAGPDESKTIYDAMTSALAHFTAAKETP